MPLSEYKKKRDFKKTPEPVGKKEASQGKNLYLIQKHAASHLHYDFRLEMNGVLKSWAVPKGPSLDPAVKRLAVHVEDHPLDYGSFEGIIPKGQYGGGTVMMWDQGTWENDNGNATAAYKKGDLTFTLKGKRLKGRWKLIRIKSDPKNWLLMKLDDKYAKPADEYDITEAENTSVASKKSMSEIAESQTQWQAKKKVKLKPKLKSPTLNIAQVDDAKKQKMPAEVSPQLATLVGRVPTSDLWLHEIKFDGYRLIARIENNKVSLITRGQQDWTHKLTDVAAAIKALNLKDAILDGEIVALNKEQRYDFQLLQNTIHQKSHGLLIYYCFDLIYYHGYDLTNVPLIERKQLLRKLLPNDEQTLIRYSDHVQGSGEVVFKEACNLSLEGIVSKKADSPYVSKRTKNWLKIKCVKRQEVIIGGFTKPKGERKHFGSLLLGYFKNNKLHYCGHVGTGFTDASLKELYSLMQKYETDTTPFAQRPPKIRDVTWLEPKIVAEVEFTEWTEEGVLRHPSFKGVRSDKPAKDVVREIPQQPAEGEGRKMKAKSTKKIIATEEKKFELTNPDRILYPKQKITKLELASFYDEIQDWILPYVTNRPLTLVRCPQGMASECFYQKHLDDSQLRNLYTKTIKEKQKGEYIYIKDIKGLIALVQLGVLEIHPWNCRIDNTEKPDMFIFDLDPAPDVPWRKVVEAAHYLRELLADINLISFVKLTGGKGVHVVIPIKRLYSWQQVKDFAHAIVDAVVAIDPKHFIGQANKEKRKGKIFLDYLRDQKGATSVAAYSTRAKENAAVATPISWDELTTKIKSDSYTIKNLPERLANLKNDPWADFFNVRQTLPLKKLKF